MKKAKSGLMIIIWLILMVVISNTGVITALLNGGQQETAAAVTEDGYMTTKRYQVNIRVAEDNTYYVDEIIDVNFQVPRHGIYRYIPYKGTLAAGMEDGSVDRILYRSDINLIATNTTVDDFRENDNAVFQFGDEDYTVTSAVYDFSYAVKPVTQKGYTNAYYNIYPTGWQNAIPAGSQFTVEFPKEFSHDILNFYYGLYGEMKDAEEILDLRWSGNTLTGTLTEALPVGNGITFYAPMPEGYFEGVKTTSGIPVLLIGISAAALLAAGILFFLFGRDEKIYPSIQYYPPKGLDSAAVGYVIDGSVEDKDIVSLLVYWADKGYLKIKEDSNGQMIFIKQKNLNDDDPQYARTIFNGIFGGNAEIGKQVALASLKYKFVSKMQKAKKQLKKDLDHRGKGGVFTTASQNSRFLAGILSAAPLGVFVFMAGRYSIGSGMYIWGGIFFVCYVISLIFLCYTVDKWYARSSTSQRANTGIGVAICLTGLVGFAASYLIRVQQGLVFNFTVSLIFVLISSVLTLILTVFMKKRTHQSVEWMGYLIGLRDFIETAELDRMKMLADESPNWFYHVMPYAYVFGLSSVWMKKFEQIAVPAPDWYVSSTGRMDAFDFYIFHGYMMRNLNEATRTFVTPKPETSSSSGGSLGGGGGFGGGGFSGGGFGGGGGGSW